MERLNQCVITLTALLYLASQALCQMCNRPCICHNTVPQCPAGVALVLDACRCCQVCAQQRGEPCTEMLPCDKRKGLECDFSASFPGDSGQCVSKEDLSCTVNGITYLNGQSFQPSCDSYCQCRGGGVSCVPACPLTGRLPTSNCPHPQFVRLPGKCCREWVCENLKNTVIQDAITAMKPGRSGQIMQKTSLSASNCVEQATQWSACSRSCGTGVSTRVSNQNPACRLQMETRLCKVRPCVAVHSALWKRKRGEQGRCKVSYRPPGPIRLVHQGCYSTQAYQVRYCGQCSDSRCCTPHRTSTAQVTFRCPTGKLMQRAVMMIHSCVCHNNCPYAPYTNPALWAYRP